MLGILISILIIINAINNIYYPHKSNLSLKFYYISIIFGGIFSILFGLGLRLSNTLKVNLSVLFITICISVYIFETYLFYSQKQTRQAKAEQLGIEYDNRTRMEVIEDLNNSGIESYPRVVPINLTSSNGIANKNARIYPLGNISNISTILSKLASPGSKIN